MSEVYFITGAQGCIGSWIVKALTERGDQAVVFDRSDDSRRLAAIMAADAVSYSRLMGADEVGTRLGLNPRRRRPTVQLSFGGTRYHE